MNWRVSFYSAELQEEILWLPAGLVARFLRYAERMEVYGPDLGMPHTRAMGEGLFELRLKAVEGIARVLYCTLVGRRVVMLHQFRQEIREDSFERSEDRTEANERGERCGTL